MQPSSKPSSLQSVAWETGLAAVKESIKCASFDAFRAHLVENMRQNSEEVRRRYASLILLRLAGQGLSSHTAQTTMARYYDRERGKALSISGLGYPLGEAVLPSIIAGLLLVFHWRATWALIAAVIGFIFIPILWHLINNHWIFHQL